jgi:hypothetical protein
MDEPDRDHDERHEREAADHAAVSTSGGRGTPGSGTISPVRFGPVETVTVLPKAFASASICCVVFGMKGA